MIQKDSPATRTSTSSRANKSLAATARRFAMMKVTCRSVRFHPRSRRSRSALHHAGRHHPQRAMIGHGRLSYAPPNRRVCSSSRRAISASTSPISWTMCARALGSICGTARRPFSSSGAQVIHAPVRVIGHAITRTFWTAEGFRWSPCPRQPLSCRRPLGIAIAPATASRFQNTRKATTMPTRTRVKEMPSTQRTTPGVSPCRAFVVASLGGGWSDMRDP